jgi:peptidoglycan/LPS O-acetylase OafA/YrhL
MIQPSYQAFRATKRFGSLDALRCISIIVVIFSHTIGSVTFPIVETQFIGLAGVRLFFAISGFLITTLLLRERDATGGINLRNFVVRRTLRIFPLYYTILFAYIVLTLLTDRHDEVGRQFFRNLPFFATYTSNWFVNNNPAHGADRVLFLFAWSLATEEQFYLLWPSVEKFAGEARAAMVMIAVTLFLIVYRIALYHGLVSMPILLGGFPGIFLRSVSLAICSGVLIAHALHTPRGFALLARFWTPFNSIIGLALLTWLVLYSPSEILKSLACTFVVLSCVQSETHALSGLFQSKPLVAVGVVSYGMYLMHLLCNHTVKVICGHLHIAETGTGGWIQFVLTTLLTFTAASISFRYYEAIFLRMKHRFEPQRDRSSVPASAEVATPALVSATS